MFINSNSFNYNFYNNVNLKFITENAWLVFCKGWRAPMPLPYHPALCRSFLETASEGDGETWQKAHLNRPLGQAKKFVRWFEPLPHSPNLYRSF